MNVINRRGRVLLDVYEAGVYQGWGILYSYRGPGMGGRGDKASLDMVIQCIKADHPSARIVGELPTPPTEGGQGGHHGQHHRVSGRTSQANGHRTDHPT